MEYALKIFKQRIDFLQRQLDSQAKSKELRKHFSAKKLSIDVHQKLKFIIDNNTDEKVYQYTANIISLYSGVESFIEAIVDEYLKSLILLFPSYKSLKDATKITDYMSSGVSLLRHAEERKFKNLKKEDVLKGLYGALVNDDSRVLHSEAYIDQGGGNYKHDNIMKCFSFLGQKDVSGKLKKFDPLKSYIAKNGIDASSNLYMKVDDLVERRNELAHGTNTPELMDVNTFRDYLSFFCVYAETINNYLDNQLKQYEWALLKCNEIKPRVYSNNIICLTPEMVALDTEFAKGQQLLIEHDDKYYYGSIDNIKVDNSDLNCYKKNTEDIEIGLKIRSDFKITKEIRVKFK